MHAAIAMAEAVLVHQRGQRGSDRSHQESLRALIKLCHRPGSHNGIDRFGWLLGRKTDFSYGERTIRPEEVQEASTHAERFFTWAYREFPEIGRA